MTDALRDRVGHTPGPWDACDQGDYSDFDGNSRVILGDDMRIAVVQWSPGDRQAESDANALLIAAAPELLEALVEAERHFGPFAEITINGQRDPEDVRVTALIRAAIAKATGATS